ncbi:MAG: nickel pincer cofactor biosynthesis protein LarB [Butyrivibrio sp.]|nr:nickel pincer cofactor biosynthesis protein LarB [Muribaculum sp.]MCM1552798.1 nickel pincer cofactor biosynthesis protein LarB [Butyrivibrio sp.]
MEQERIRELLEGVQAGRIDVEEAVLRLREAPYVDLDFAKLDTHRKLRQGVSEVIYGAGKTGEQILAIARKLLESGEKTVLITRMTGEKAEYVTKALGERIAVYEPLSGICIAGELPEVTGRGTIVVATGGTSDLPVAEEAALTAIALGNEVVRVYDVGVAGLHRLFGYLDDLMSARVIIAVAGMEGALASVIGGLVSCPVLAVPTSVGYGANFGGLSALLSMLNSCASGVSVVNIDNGFGAGYQASLINHI